jgi:hypothetical protein
VGFRLYDLSLNDGFTPAAFDLRRQVRLYDLSLNDGRDTFSNSR